MHWASYHAEVSHQSTEQHTENCTLEKKACQSSCHQGRRREYSWNEAIQWSVLWLIDFQAFKDLSVPLCVKSQGIFPATVRVLLAMTLCPWGQPRVQTLPSSRSEPQPGRGQIPQPADISFSVWHPTDFIRSADWENCTTDPEPKHRTDSVSFLKTYPSAF